VQHLRHRGEPDAVSCHEKVGVGQSEPLVPGSSDGFDPRPHIQRTGVGASKRHDVACRGPASGEELGLRAGCRHLGFSGGHVTVDEMVGTAEGRGVEASGSAEFVRLCRHESSFGRVQEDLLSRRFGESLPRGADLVKGDGPVLVQGPGARLGDPAGFEAVADRAR
jgi:hypothetical protein